MKLYINISESIKIILIILILCSISWVVHSHIKLYKIPQDICNECDIMNYKHQESKNFKKKIKLLAILSAIFQMIGF
jgi:hypothetical protein